MSFGLFPVKRRVWVGLGCAVTLVAAYWSWTRDAHLAVTPRGPGPQPFVRITGAGDNPTDRILRERADLLDPTPLFFPTEWNYGQGPLPERLRRQPGQVFGSFDAKLSFPEQELKLTIGETTPTPEKPADVLNQGNESPFAGLGRVDVPRQPLPERSAVVEVRSFKSGQVIINQSLVGIPIPRPDFSPVEFIVVVSPAGVVGEPLLASGSGWDDVDSFFRTYLVKTFRVGERLLPGSYRVLVGP